MNTPAFFEVLDKRDMRYPSIVHYPVVQYYALSTTEASSVPTMLSTKGAQIITYAFLGGP